MFHPDNSEEHLRYTRAGQIHSSTNQDGVTTIYHWDPLNRLQAKEDPFGIEYFYYEGLLLTKSVDVTGVEIFYRYDPFGRMIEKAVGDRKEQVTYDNQGYPCRKSYFDGELLLSTEVTVRDGLGRELERWIEDPSGTPFGYKRFAYDGAGNCTAEWDGDAKTERVFDGKNRIIRIVNPLKQVDQVCYRKVQKGGTLEEKTVTDPLGHQVVTLYNAYGKPVLVRHLDKFGLELLCHSFYYDLAGQLIKEDKKGAGQTQTVVYERDVRGRISAQIEPLRKITRNRYTLSGQLEERTKPDGTRLSYAYHQGRLVSLRSSDGQIAYRFSYSPKGELTEVLDEVSRKISRQTFSIYGDLIKEEIPNGQTINYGYDGLGRVISYNLPDGGTVHLTYNAKTATSISRLNEEGNTLYTHVYSGFNERGDVTDQQLVGEAGEIHCTLDAMYQLKSTVHPHYKQENIAYDSVGNIVSFELNGENHCFSYDNLNQLTKETGHSYTFDPFLNRTSKDEVPYALNSWNGLTSAGINQYAYDLNGRLIKIETASDKIELSYDSLDRLISIKKGEEQVHFTYDPFNRRISRNGKPFFYFREQEIGNDQSLRILGLGLGGDVGATVAIELDGQVFAPLHDHNGSIVGLVDLEGTLIESWLYTAFGEPIGTISSPWTFSSKRVEPLTSFLSFGHRDYDPETGRWTTPDPLGLSAGPNLYTYVSNCPLNKRDPLGLFEIPHLEMPAFMSPLQTIGNYVLGNFEPRVVNFKYESKLPWWDRSAIYPVGQVTVPNRGVGFHNGMYNTVGEALLSGQHISDLGNGIQVDVFHNSTHGHFDVIEAALGRAYIATEPVELLHKGWNDFFLRNPDGYYLMFCHSQGAINTRNALLQYNPELAKRIRVVAIAPGAYIHSDSCMSVTHYRTISWLRDPVPHLCDLMGAWREASSIKELASHFDAPLHDHALSSKTYELSIEFELRDFSKWVPK